MIFFKFSTVIWLSTTTEKLPPVVVVIFRVICDTTEEDEPHPSLKSRESLPDGNFSIFCFSIYSTPHSKNPFERRNNFKKNYPWLTLMYKRYKFFFFANGLLLYATQSDRTHRRAQAKPNFLSAIFRLN